MATATHSAGLGHLLPDPEEDITEEAVTTLDTDGEQLDCSLGAALAGLARGDDSRLGRRLRVLKLRNANLSGALGKDVFARMVSLDVSMNSVTSLDGLTAAAPMLASLSASHNPLLEHFNSGPSVGAAPSGLRDLDLSHCGLTELPSLRHCASLVRATLAFNRIASLRPLPRRFPPSLVTLSLQGMAVELLPETRPLAALPNLQSLDLKGNPAVSAFPATALEPLMAFLLPQLRLLDGLPVSRDAAQRAEALFRDPASGEFNAVACFAPDGHQRLVALLTSGGGAVPAPAPTAPAGGHPTGSLGAALARRSVDSAASSAGSTLRASAGSTLRASAGSTLRASSELPPSDARASAAPLRRSIGELISQGTAAAPEPRDLLFSRDAPFKEVPVVRRSIGHLISEAQPASPKGLPPPAVASDSPRTLPPPPPPLVSAKKSLFPVAGAGAEAEDEATDAADAAPAPEAVSALAAEVAALRAEVARLREAGLSPAPAPAVAVQASLPADGGAAVGRLSADMEELRAHHVETVAKFEHRFKTMQQQRWDELDALEDHLTGEGEGEGEGAGEGEGESAKKASVPAPGASAGAADAMAAAQRASRDGQALAATVAAAEARVEALTARLALAEARGASVAEVAASTAAVSAEVLVRVSHLEGAVDDLRIKADGLKRVAARAADDDAVAADHIVGIGDQLAAHEEEMAAIRNVVDGLGEALSAGPSLDADDLRARLAAAESAVAALGSERSALRTAVSGLELELSTLRASSGRLVHARRWRIATTLQRHWRGLCARRHARARAEARDRRTEDGGFGSSSSGAPHRHQNRHRNRQQDQDQDQDQGQGQGQDQHRRGYPDASGTPASSAAASPSRYHGRYAEGDDDAVRLGDHVDDLPLPSSGSIAAQRLGSEYIDEAEHDRVVALMAGYDDDDADALEDEEHDDDALLGASVRRALDARRLSELRHHKAVVAAESPLQWQSRGGEADKFARLEAAAGGGAAGGGPAGQSSTRSSAHFVSHEAEASGAYHDDDVDDDDEAVWFETLDKSSGRCYYFHSLTQKVTWTVPQPPENVCFLSEQVPSDEM